MFHAFREREELQNVMEEVSGGRMHYMFNRVGGLKEDLPGRLGHARACAPSPSVRSRMDVYDKLVLGNEIFRGRTRGVGVLSPEAVHAYGVSGPIARASGVDFDLRRDEPYLAYGELQDTLKVVTRQEGDCLARFEVPPGADPQRPRPRRRLPGPARRAAAGARQPAAARRCSRRPRATPTRGPRTRSASTATTWSPRARRRPYRLKLRSASYNNIQALAELLPGTLVADMVAILGSLFFVVGDIDK